MITHYRVDKRLFSVGQEISSAQEYYGKFRGINKIVEDTLESRRPEGKPRRTECLFVFEDEACAKKHWSKMQDGKLYKVEIKDTTVFHRGDMSLMDIMKRLGECDEDMTNVADTYWRGEHSPEPEIEIMISSAVVTEVVSTSDQERQDHFRKRHQVASGPLIEIPIP